MVEATAPPDVVTGGELTCEIVSAGAGELLLKCPEFVNVGLSSGHSTGTVVVCLLMAVLVTFSITAFLFFST